MSDHREPRAGLLCTVTGIVIAVIGACLLARSLVREIRVNEAETVKNSLSVSGTVHYDQETPLESFRSLRKSTKQVLFLSSYDPTSVYYDEQIGGMLSVSDSNEIEFDVINMDSLKHHSEDDLEMVEQWIRERLAEKHYYGLIVADDFALQFAMRHRDDYFKDLPIIFLRSTGLRAGL